MNALRHLPNLLTVLRLAAAPLTADLVLQGRFGAALLVFALAGLSDAMDGYLAKRLSPGSRFGAYLDPAADKLLMLASFLTLTLAGQIPWWLTTIVIARDVAIVLGVVLARLLGLPLKIAPLMIGKASTVVQVGYIVLTLLLLAFDLSLPGLTMAAALVTMAFTLASWLFYAQLWFRAVAFGRRHA